jgi:hypothetical protein
MQFQSLPRDNVRQFTALQEWSRSGQNSASRIPSYERPKAAIGNKTDRWFAQQMTSVPE